MNKERRKAINEIIGRLDELKADIEALQDEEQEYYDNMPEGIQYGEKGNRAQEAIDALEEAVSNLDDAIGSLEMASE